VRSDARYHEGVKLRILVLAAFSIGAFAQAKSELSQVQSIYLLPMAYNMDQYLANHLTALGFVRVVADPSKADAVFTDRLGKGFETEMGKLYPVPKPATEVKDADAAKADSAELTRREQAVYASTGGFSKGKGNVFLVDRRTHAVIWSNYDRPKNTTPDVLDETADRITKQLLKDFKGN
jgi:hypothetical protein